MPTLVLHQHVSGGGPQGSPPGIPVLTSAVLYVLVVLAGLVLAPYLTGVRVAARALRILTGSLAAAYAGLMLAVIARGESFTLIDVHDGTQHTLLIALHLVAAAVWAGGVLHLAFVGKTAGREALGTALRRFSPYAIGSALALPVTGVGLVLIHHVQATQLTGTTWGRLILVKSGLLVASVLLALGHRRARRGRTRLALLRTESAALASVVGVAVVLTGLPDPAAAVTSLAPGLSTVALGDDAAPLFLHQVSPQRAQLLYGGDDAGEVSITDRTSGRIWRPTRAGDVTEVGLTDGRAHVLVTQSGASRTVTLAPAPAGGSLSFALGQALGTGVEPGVAAVSCTASAAALGTAYGRVLSSFHLDSVSAVSDSTARARAFIRGLSHTFPGTVTTVSPAVAARGARTIVVAGGHRAARATLTAMTTRLKANRGIYLAPWLLQGDLLSTTTARRLPLVSVAAYVDPMSPAADDYRLASTQLMPGLDPTIDALRGYLAVTDPDLAYPSQLVFYAAAPVGFLPGILDVGHQHSSDGWFHDGTLTAMNHGVPLHPTCSNH